MAILTRVPTRRSLHLNGVFDRLLNETSLPQSFHWDTSESARSAALNMYETDDDVVLTMPLPGINPDAIDMSIVDRVLNIRAASQPAEETGTTKWLCRELYSGDYARTIALPPGIDGDKAEANYEAGIISIRIPKTPESKPRQIKVRHTP